MDGNTFYQADANGVAQIDKTMPSFSMHLRDELPVYGRTVVVHLASDSAVKPACGVIGGAFGVTGAAAFTEQFPGYDGAYPSVRAAAHVTESDGTLTITAVMTGLGANTEGGWHIHSGFSCDDAGGHYFEGLPDDPWCSSCTKWFSDNTGVADGDVVVVGLLADGRAAGVGAHVRGARQGRQEGGVRRDRAVDDAGHIARCLPPATRAAGWLAVLLGSRIGATACRSRV